MTWATPTSDLRNILYDNATDKLSYRKAILGIKDSTNKVFKTFEWRRLTNFTTATSGPLGVYTNGTRVAVDSDDPVTGEFTIHTAPGVNDYFEATYYLQWFTDDELNGFITAAVEWLGLGTDANSVADGLKPSALKYAAAEAYQMLAVRWTFKLSEGFRMEDAPDPDRMKSLNAYQIVAKQYYDVAHTLRDDYYTRQGQSLQPLYGNNTGTVVDVQPRR